MEVRRTRTKKIDHSFLPPFRRASASDRRHITWLLTAIVTVHCLTLSTVPVTNTDDQIMLTCAFNFTETGKFTAPTRFATKRVGGAFFGREAMTGEVYAKYPPGYPLILALFIPLARLSSILFGPVGAEILLCLPSVLAIAATCWVLWRFELRLGIGMSAVICSLVGFALGSFVWPYAGINWSEPFQILCLAAASYSLLAASQEEKHWMRYYLLGGCALGLGVLIKATLVILAPVLFLGAYLSWRGRIPSRDKFVRSAMFVVPAILAFSYLLAMNYYLFGSLSDFGYRGTFSHSFTEGLYGLTFGLRKGLAFFFPLAVLAPLGAWKLSKGSSFWVAVVLGVQAVVYLALISKWHMYEGGYCWGPRLIMPIVPALVILAGAFLDSIAARRLGWVLVGAGMAVNSLGALINYQSFYGVARNSRAALSQIEPNLAQIPGHFWLLKVELTTPFSSPSEAGNPSWEKPPWISRHPQAVPLPYTAPGQAILNPWPLRLLLPETRWKREEWWYLRALLEVAIMKYEQGDMRDALDLLDRGLSVAGQNPRFLAAKGLVYSTVGDLTQALNSYHRALAADPDYSLALYGQGMVLETLGNFAAARQAYERVLSLPPGTIDPEEVQKRLVRLIQ